MIFSTSKVEWGWTSNGTYISSTRQYDTLLVTNNNDGNDIEIPVNGLFKATHFVLAFDVFPDKEDGIGIIGMIFRSSDYLETFYKFEIS